MFCYFVLLFDIREGDVLSLIFHYIQSEDHQNIALIFEHILPLE